jgi:putative addiction module component (TIGR02574 family)
MPVSLESLGIDRMSLEDRLALVQAIWDSIAAAEPPPVSEPLRAELAAALANIERGARVRCDRSRASIRNQLESDSARWSTHSNATAIV